MISTEFRRFISHLVFVVGYLTELMRLFESLGIDYGRWFAPNCSEMMTKT